MTTSTEHAESPFSDEEEANLAFELLAVNNERDLDQFLGGLLRRTASVMGGALRSPVFHPLGGLLKGAVHSVLPGVGRALGNVLDPGMGGKLARLAAEAGQMLGMEIEGLSAEDQEFAAAKQLVRLASAAATEAVGNPSTGSPGVLAQQAAIQAAQLHAPGLLRSIPQPRQSGDCSCNGACSCQEVSSGSWVRRGHQIILTGV